MTALLNTLKRRMRVRTPLLTLALTVTLTHSAMTQAGTIEEAKARGYLLVATEDDYRPFEFMDEGKATGYDNELLALVEKSTGLKIRQQVLPWAGILPGVTTGKYDMALSAVLVTQARKATFDFTSPTAEVTSYFATRKGSPILKPQDLIGKTVGAETGSAMLTDLKDFDAKLKAKGPGLKEIVEYHGYPEAYQDLGNGRLDAVANTDMSLQALIKERGDMFVIGQPIGAPTYLAWAVAKGNTGVLKTVDAALLELRKNGEMARLQTKWLGVSHNDMPLDVN